MTTQNNSRPKIDCSTIKWQVTEMSMMPDWLRDLFLVLYVKVRALLRSAFPLFLLFCLITSLKKLLAATTLTLYGPTFLVTDVLLVLYAAWHVYHDGHHVIACRTLVAARARFAQRWKIKGNGFFESGSVQS